MRVVYLNPSGQMGGAEMSLMDLLASMRAAEPGWDFWLVLGEDGPLAGQARAAGAQVILAPFPRALARLGDSGSGPLRALWSCFKASPGTMRYASSLRRTLKELQPDIVHTNGFKMHVLGAWAHPANTPVIWHVRDYVSTRPLMKRLLSMHAGRCAAAIGNSESVARDIQKVCGPELETLCVYNAIDLKRYSPMGEKMDLDSLAGLKSGVPEHGPHRPGGHAGPLERACGISTCAGAAAQGSFLSGLRHRRTDLSNRQQPAHAGRASRLGRRTGNRGSSGFHRLRCRHRRPRFARWTSWCMPVPSLSLSAA